jgi:hypothetical protein
MAGRARCDLGTRHNNGAHGPDMPVRHTIVHCIDAASLSATPPPRLAYSASRLAMTGSKKEDVRSSSHDWIRQG